jgi:methylase of polypeptide subunit release factors
MKLDCDAVAVGYLRRYFDESKYAMVDFRLSFEAPNGPTGFPKFEQLQNVVARLDGVNRVIFRLFRLGESVDTATVEKMLPAEVRGAMQRVGLLRQHGAEWRTPNLLLLPVEGVLLFVSVPPSYPTATAPCRVWFDLSSCVFAKALPLDLSSQNVLDICSGSGVQSLLCAKRGARSVVGLELEAEAIELARFNAVFNGVSACTEFRRSDKLEALRADERFDYLLCNTPHAPVTGGPETASSFAEIGNRTLFDFIEALPSHFAPQAHGVIALWRSIGTRDNNGQRDRVAKCLADHGLATAAFVDRAQDGFEGALRILEADVKLRHGTEAAIASATAIRKLIDAAGDSVDGSYNQLIFFEAGPRDGAAVFGLVDPVPARH